MSLLRLPQLVRFAKIIISFLGSRSDMSVVLCRSHSADGYRPLADQRKGVARAPCRLASDNGVIQPWANQKDAEHDVAKEVRGAHTVRVCEDGA